LFLCADVPEGDPDSAPDSAQLSAEEPTENDGLLERLHRRIEDQVVEDVTDRFGEFGGELVEGYLDRECENLTNVLCGGRLIWLDLPLMSRMQGRIDSRSSKDGCVGAGVSELRLLIGFGSQLGSRISVPPSLAIAACRSCNH
jgi:hypothetical protein